MGNVIEVIVSVKDGASKGLSKITSSLDAIGRAAKKALLPLGLAVAASLKAFASFETAFAGVRKTVDATAKEFAILERGIRNMAKEIPATTTEIAGVAEAAGQLGIQKESILDFTRTMIDLGNTTNLSAQEAATSLARLANITQLPQDQFDELGSTIVALGNNFATTEAEIVQLGLRIAGTGKQIGLAESEILGFATALSSVGIRAEQGGTAISRVFADMASAAAQGGEKLQGFADIAGVSAEEFRKSFEEDAAGAVVGFIEGLDRMSKSGDNVFAALEGVGFQNIRVRDTLLRAAGAGDLMREALDLGAKSFKENNALTEEAAKRYETLASKFTIATSKIKDAAIELGERLAPAFIDILEKVGDFADAMGVVFKNFPELANTAAQAIRVAFVENFALTGAAIIDIFGRMGMSLLENFGNILIEIGAIVLKASAAIVSPLAVAFDVLGDNIRFGWQILVNNLAERMIKAAIFMADKLNIILPKALEFDTSGLTATLKGIEEEVLEAPQTFADAWEKNGEDVGLILASTGENFTNLKELFLNSIGEIRSGMGEFAELPEMQIFLDRLNELLEEAGTSVGEFSESTKEKIQDAFASEDSMENVRETWETWFGDWMSAGEETLVAFQELSKNTFESFKQGVGDAFGAAIVFGENLGQSLKKVLQGIAANVISALVQIGVQRVAQAIIAKAVSTTEATTRMAVLSAETFAGAFAATAAIPVIGPVIAPGVAAASTAAMLAGAGTAGASGAATGLAIAGAAAGGLDDVPATGTFLLHQGERVLAPEQNRDLKKFMKNGGGVTIGKLSMFEGANLTEAFLDAPPDTFRKISEKILVGLNELGDEGSTTTLKSRKRNF